MARPAVQDCIDDYDRAKMVRNPHEADWKLASAYCLPQHYGAWVTEGPVVSNQAALLRRTVYDSTGTRSLPKYMAILERLATPWGQRYQSLVASVPSLMKNYRVRSYFDELSALQFKMRYTPRANFRAASNETYAGLGAYGTGPMYVAKRTPNALSRTPGMIYKGVPLRDVFFLVNSNGEVDKVFRRYYHNLRMFREEHKDAPLPPTLMREAAKPAPDQSVFVELFHVVQPRTDYDPEALDTRANPFVSSHVCVADRMYIGEEGGYQSMPYLTPRTFTVAGDPYGHGPAVNAIASMGGASAIKKSYLKQGNLAAEPVVLAYDDGVLNGNVDLRPGHVNYGGVDRSGRKLIQTLDQTGNFQINEVLLEGDRKDTEDSFFVTLFQILTDTPEMTATEVLERVAEKAALLSPTMGRLQSELLGPLTERELHVFEELGVLPEMPPELVEARGEYEIQYSSPMAKGMYAEEISGFMRSVEFALQIVEATQDPSHLDHFDFDVALPEIADKSATPTRWLASPDKVEAKRAGRQQQQETQQAIEAAPAAASVAKTVADMQKAPA